MGRKKNVRFSPKQRTTLEYDDAQSLGSVSDSELSVSLERQPNKSILLNKKKLLEASELSSSQDSGIDSKTDSSKSDLTAGQTLDAGKRLKENTAQSKQTEPGKKRSTPGKDKQSSLPLSFSKSSHPNKYCELGLTKNKDYIPVTTRTHNTVYTTPPGSLKRSGYSVTYVHPQAQRKQAFKSSFSDFRSSFSQKTTENQSSENHLNLEQRTLKSNTSEQPSKGTTQFVGDLESTSEFTGNSSEVFDDRLQDFEEDNIEYSEPYSTQPTSNDNSAQHYMYNSTSARVPVEVEYANVSHRTTSSMIASDYIPGNPSLNRLQEKHELRELNDRLSSYLLRVKQLSEQGNHVDSSAFLKSAQILEDEIKNLKNLYERELDSVRRQLDDVCREKTHYHMHMQKNEGLASSLQDRLAIEGDKNRKLTDDINMLQRSIQQKDRELEDLRIDANRPVDDLNQVARDNGNLIRENADLKRRYERELVMRQEAEDKVHNLTKKVDFDCEVYNKQTCDTQDRLESAAATILTLESKVRELSKPDTSLSDMLTRVRESAEFELHRYQRESEHNYQQNLTSLTAQMREDSVSLENLSIENTRLSGLLEEANAKVKNLQGQLAHMDHQKRSLQENSDLERSRHAEHSRNLERKLHDLQDVLFVKMRDLNSARDAHIPLKAEIESLRTILEEEEKRLRLPILPTSPRPPLMTSIVHANHPTSLSNVYTAPAMARPPTPTRTPSPILTSVTRAPEKILTEHLPPPLEAPVLFNRSCSPVPATPPPGPSQYELGPLTGGPVPRSSPLGPVRAKSAPVSHERSYPHLVPTSLGQGKDYFDEMFKDLERTTYQRPDSAAGRKERPSSSVSHDYENSTSSATGDIRIFEVNQDGRYVRLVNNSETKDDDFGGFLLQQNVGGHPVAVYRFPPRTQFKANSTITVWSGSNDPILHQPPTDFVWKEQEKWGTGPECTTILCKPNGQAIAWTTAAHRFTPNLYEENGANSNCDSPDFIDNFESSKQETVLIGEPILTESMVDVNAPRPEPMLLRREKTSPPTLSPQNHPHGQYTAADSHPGTFQSRPQTMGNDNSSHVRQSRSQTTRPDIIKGQPYCGATAQRMGSAPLRKYTTSAGNIRGSGALANKSMGSIRYGLPSPFLSPLQQEYNRAASTKSTSLVRFATTA